MSGAHAHAGTQGEPRQRRRVPSPARGPQASWRGGSGGSAGRTSPTFQRLVRGERGGGQPNWHAATSHARQGLTPRLIGRVAHRTQPTRGTTLTDARISQRSAGTGTCAARVRATGELLTPGMVIRLPMTGHAAEAPTSPPWFFTCARREGRGVSAPSVRPAACDAKVAA